MKIVVCTIQVVFLHFFSTTDARGKVIRENTEKYLVDFSEEAKAKGYDGDYSMRLVNKNMCIVLKEKQ